MASDNDIRYLTPISIETTKEKYCRFKKAGIKYIDYKDTELLKKFLNSHGRVLSSKRTGVSSKYQRMLKEAVKRARFMALLPYISK